MEFQSGAVRPIGSIEDGWQIIKDDYWTFFSMTLVAIVILVVAAVILGLINNVITLAISSVLGAATGGSGHGAAQMSAAIFPQVISLVISIFTNVIVTTVSGAFFCGIYAALVRKTTTGVAEFNDLFAGFSKFQACLIVAVVMSIIQFAISLVTLLGGAALGVSVVGAGLLTADGKFNPAVFGGLFLAILALLGFSIVVNLIVSALTSFAYPLIADRDLSGGQALATSVKSGFANLGGLILLLLLLGLIMIGGVLACLVGILFVAPLMSASLFAAYQSVFGKKANSYQNYAPPPPPNFSNQPGY